MKVLILAGGKGTRISEESHLRPKPMVEIGGLPILIHIMNIYSSYGFNDFVILGGYKQHIIKEYFANYYLYNNDVTFDFSNNTANYHNSNECKWKVTVLDTGLDTMTGGRIKRAKDYINNEDFLLTYGDAVGDINIKKLVEYHYKKGGIATISTYNFGQNKGVVEVDDGRVSAFREKADTDGDLINIGFMVLNSEILKYIEGDATIFEKDVLPKLASEGKLNSFIHHGFWQCMDTMREKEALEQIWNTGNAPWLIHKEGDE